MTGRLQDHASDARKLHLEHYEFQKSPICEGGYPPRTPPPHFVRRMPSYARHASGIRQINSHLLL